MKKIWRLGGITVATIFTLSGLCAAQGISLQGNNELKWADGIEYISSGYTGKRYFENRLNLDLYYNDLRIGTRLTALQPSEFGETKTGTECFEKRFIEYRDSERDIEVRVGNFYTVWGRGLTLALVEDIYQGFDSGLDGILAKAGWGPVQIEALAGRSATDSQRVRLVREAQVNGAHLALSLPSGFTATGQALLVDSVASVSFTETHCWGGYLAYDGPFTSAWVEHSKQYVTNCNDEHYATYGSISGFSEGIGIALDYKNYKYFNYPGDGLHSDNSILSFHNPPIVQREFTSNLFSKHPHQPVYEDEVGVQIELTWTPGNWGNVILASSLSSSHPDSDGPVPTLNEEDSPYREAFLEVNSYPGLGMFLSGWTGLSEELIYVGTVEEGSRVAWNQRAVLGARLEAPVMDQFAALVSAEGMTVNDKVSDDTFPEARVELGFIYQSNYTLTGSFEMSDESGIARSLGRDTWFNVQGRAFIAGRHELIIMAGQERGGLVCSSGKCRLVEPFNGIKLTLVSLL